MLKQKSRRQLLVEIARKFSGSHSKEYTLEDLVQWAIDTGQWELSQQDIFRLARDEFRGALKASKDEGGVRWFLDVKLEQQHFWAHRKDATWKLRQAFLDAQACRVARFRQVVIDLRDKLNEERKPREREFQVVFDWE